MGKAIEWEGNEGEMKLRGGGVKGGRKVRAGGKFGGDSGIGEKRRRSDREKRGITAEGVRGR